MDAPLMSKFCTKTNAERPYSSDESEATVKRDERQVMSGSCTLPNQSKKRKKEKYNAHLRKPDSKEEVLILVCIIKKGIKILCRHGQNRRHEDCKTPDYNQIYFFIDIAKRLDRFKDRFVSTYCSNNNICCYAKLLRDLKLIRCCFSKQIEMNYCVFKCKIDLINCIMACFHSIENKVCFIMACSSSDNDKDDHNCGPNFENSKSKLCDRICSKLSLKSSKLSLHRGSQYSSKCGSMKKQPSSKNTCEFLDSNDRIGDKNSSQTFDMTLEYCKYNATSNDSGSSDNEETIEAFTEELSGGYVQSKLYKKDDRVTLSLKCVTDSDSSAIVDLKKCAEVSEKKDQLMKIADDMAKLLSLSKEWYTSGKKVCQEMLKKC